MTFSILARDMDTGAVGGAAATGSLCVGGWVLRADPRAGVSASQGAAPSTFWGEEALARMGAGQGAAAAVAGITREDAGAAHRQLSALDLSGGAGAFTGGENTDAKGARQGDGWVVAGNLLASDAVLDAVAEGYARASGTLPDRLLSALRAGDHAGSDSRGLLSAALLVVAPDAAPLTLRVDWSETPLADLAHLLVRTRDPDYAAWLGTVPTLADPERAG
jgi:uncharacterized Ntn-hydrolase superfamily protein